MSQSVSALKARPSDVDTPEHLVAALYESVSYLPFGEPDWDRARSLFFPGALIAPPWNQDGRSHTAMSLEAFIDWAKPQFLGPERHSKGFYEREYAHTMERFGNVVHVFSTYLSFWKKDDPEPWERGINSIQLAWDGGRWWCMSVVWDIESPEKPIPAKYLG